jgi:hypothetical protein
MKRKLEWRTAFRPALVEAKLMGPGAKLLVLAALPGLSLAFNAQVPSFRREHTVIGAGSRKIDRYCIFRLLAHIGESIMVFSRVHWLDYSSEMH